MLRRTAAVGFVVWALASTVPGVRLPPVDGLLVLGVLVIVPLALSLVAPGHADATSAVYRAVAWLLPLAAMACAGSFWLAPGPRTAGLAAPWMGLSLLVGWLGRARLTRGGWRDPEALCVAMSLLLFPIGGMWMLASRFGAQPFDFDPSLVMITALHFHFAVLVTPLLGALALGTRRERRTRRGAHGADPLAWPLATGVVAGPVLVAVGYLATPAVGLAGTAVLTAGMLLLAWLTVRDVLPTTANLEAKVLLGLAALATLVGMPLACVWAFGQTTGAQRLLPWAMLYLHGLANGLGFALCGLLGWVRRRPSE